MEPRNHRPQLFTVHQPPARPRVGKLLVGLALVGAGMAAGLLDIGMPVLEAALVLALTLPGMFLICRWSRP